jgi:1-deoxy-D-xylulose-5-phosphate reductoisomerase
MKKRLLILGSTGSIGRSALDVAGHLRDEWEVVGLAAGSRATDLAIQANQCRPEAVALANGGVGVELRSLLHAPARVFSGKDALVQLVESVAFDCVVCAVVGTGGLAATVRAVEMGKRVALANKESLVIAGSLIMPLARRAKATIIPVDSEHSAIFQALQTGKMNEVERILLTASGGPFRTHTVDEMESVTLEEALNHPTWNMGPKITIDSATMMNKALEIVEARWLFGLEPDRIEVAVHPESIVHSMVEFCDGSIIAQLGTPDMRTPIQYALTFPDRRPCPAPRLSLSDLRQLKFEAPDFKRFPALRLGYYVAAKGGTCGAVLNAANESAVELFRQGAIGFCDIARHAERVLEDHEFKLAPTFEELLEADRWARNEVARCTAC